MARTRVGIFVCPNGEIYDYDPNEIYDCEKVSGSIGNVNKIFNPNANALHEYLRKLYCKMNNVRSGSIFNIFIKEKAVITRNSFHARITNWEKQDAVEKKNKIDFNVSTPYASNRTNNKILFERFLCCIDAGIDYINNINDPQLDIGRTGCAIKERRISDQLEVLNKLSLPISHDLDITSINSYERSTKQLDKLRDVIKEVSHGKTLPCVLMSSDVFAKLYTIESNPPEIRLCIDPNYTIIHSASIPYNTVFVSINEDAFQFYEGPTILKLSADSESGHHSIKIIDFYKPYILTENDGYTDDPGFVIHVK